MKRRRSCARTCLIAAILLVFFAVSGYAATRRVVRYMAEAPAALPSADDVVRASAMNRFALLSNLLGFRESRTYLLLFQNNTELRPSGGFIGSYAVVRMSRGVPEILRVSGTETLDGEADAALLPEPPEPIKKYLGVDHWYFRDSNWSPDFSVAAARALELYAKENGVEHADIDAVIGITPTVMERLLDILGDVTVDQISFSSTTVTETLEYEVEYGYKDRGIAFAERKQILEPLMRTLVAQIKSNALFHHEEYVRLLEELAQEKHVVAFALDDALQASFEALGASGRLVSPKGDYLLWVDANLGALKTDHAMERALFYEAAGSGDSFTATATMRYDHRGVFDWRTTRYRAYARIYVPENAEFVGARMDGKTVDQSEIAMGIELGKRWFGTFLSVEPGAIKTLAFSYRLRAVGEPYTLFVQKQLGTIAHQLTVSVDFGTDKRLQEETDLREDYVYQESRH